MTRIEKTVFISYRRTNMPWALAIYQHLASQGYDVFFDYNSIKSGDFEQIITQNVKGRAHFLILLTPSALERCNEPGDWLRREIELAIDEKRNIVPLFFEGFSFSTPSVSNYLTGKLELLKRYNGMTVPAEYFDAAMVKLRKDFLTIPLNAVLHPISNMVEKAVKVQQSAAGNATKVQQNELNSQEWLEQGYKHLQEKNLDEAIQANTIAISLKPDFALAYVNRAAARVDKGDIDGGIYDTNEAIRLDPYIFNPYYIRGVACKKKGEIDKAIADYTIAIKLNPNHTSSFLNRSNAYLAKESWNKAIEDATKAINLDPTNYKAYNNRGIAHLNKGNLDEAIRDFTESIRISPTFNAPYGGRGDAWWRKKDYYLVIEDYQKYLDLGGPNVKEVNRRLEEAKKILGN